MESRRNTSLNQISYNERSKMNKSRKRKSMKLKGVVLLCCIIFVLGFVLGRGTYAFADNDSASDIPTVLKRNVTNETTAPKSTVTGKTDQKSVASKVVVQETAAPKTSKPQNNEESLDSIASKKVTAETSVKNNKKIITAPYINQRQDYPTGCESVSTVMALQSQGIDISVDKFIDDYLNCGETPHNSGGIRVGANPWKAFPGDPRSETGYGCFAPAIENALDKLVDQSKYNIDVLSKKSIEELCATYIDRDIPVIFWATIDMKTPRKGSTWYDDTTNEEINWIRPMHCLLLVGYDKEYYYFNDPWRKEQARYPKKSCEVAYEGLGQQAIAVYKK